MAITPLEKQMAALTLLRRRRAREDVYAFCEYTLPNFIHGDHLRRMADDLEWFWNEVRERRSPLLMVFMPPRHGKSEMISIRFPAWVLGQDPQAQIMACSHTVDLAYDHSLACRDLMNGDDYRTLFDTTVEEGGATKWRVAGKRNHRPSYVAAGVGGSITGKGADILIIDDPVKNAEEAESTLIRDKIRKWYQTTASTRLQPGGGVVIVLTRWHHDDLAGWLLNEQPNEWRVLSLPAIDADGQALWPQVFPVSELMKKRSMMGAYYWSAMYQQTPTPEEGAMFHREWWGQVHKEPGGCRYVRYWDLAGTVKDANNPDPDWTVGLKMARLGNAWFICDVVRMRETAKVVEARVRAKALEDGRRCHVIIEEEPGSAGKAVTAHYREDVLPDFHCTGERVTGAKVLRARPVAAACERREIFLVDGAWNNSFIEETALFPLGPHDDQVDALDGAWNALRALTGDALLNSIMVR